MKNVERVIVAAQRRLWVQAWFRTLGGALLVGVGLATVLLLADRLLAFTIQPPILGGVVIVPILGSICLAYWRRPSKTTVAAAIDQRLGLKDRVVSSLHSSHLSDNPFAERVIDDADREAARITVAQGFPIRLPRSFAIAAGEALILGSIAWWVPQMDLLGLNEARAERDRSQADAQQATAEVSEAAEALALTEVSEPQQGDRAEDEQALSALRELTEMGEDGLADPQDRRDAAAKLSLVREELDQRVLDQQRIADKLDNALSRLETADAGPADPVVDALRRGDTAEAIRSLQQLTESVKGLTDTERQALAEQLKELSEQLAEQARENESEPFDGAMEGASSAMRDLGEALDLSQYEFPEGESDPMDGEAEALDPSDFDPSQYDPEQLKEAAQRACEQLSEMGECKSKAKQLRSARSRVQDAIKRLAAKRGSDGEPGAAGKGEVDGQQASGRPARGRGTGEGSKSIGAPTPLDPYEKQTVRDTNEGPGRSMFWWGKEGPGKAGQPGVGYDQAVTEAQREAERAITQDDVPKRYHETIRQYFNQLPAEAPEADTTPAPATDL